MAIKTCSKATLAALRRQSADASLQTIKASWAKEPDNEDVPSTTAKSESCPENEEIAVTVG